MLRLWRPASLVCACLTAVAVAAPAAAAAVRLGSPPRLPSGARTVGSVPASTSMRVTVTLQPRDPAALAAFATEVSTPGSPLYRQYLTPAQFARRFGATDPRIKAVEGSLRAHGLHPGPASPNGLSIPVRATAGQLTAAFSTSLARIALAGGASAIANQQAPAVDASIAPDVQSVLGLNTLSSAEPLLVRAHAASATTTRLKAHVATGGPQPCPAASQAAAANRGYTEDQTASAYGLTGLYDAGDQGAGQTVAVLELEPYDPSDITAYEQCYGIGAQFSNVEVDGGAGSGEGSGEAALDIENVIGLAPQARVLVYEGPNSGAGPYDTFSAIISQHQAQVVTASWGQCEPLNGRSQAAAENTLFQEAAAQGQTILSAAGDDGSEDCYPASITLQVDDPSSQPYVTGVGGTSLTAIGPRPTEHVWNDGPTIGAGGGGISSFWTMPGYQSGAASFLHVIGSNSSGGPCGASLGYCREVPDVSADADPATGYMIYWNGSNGAGVGQPVGWQAVGGTSGAAPTWAALIALTNASASCAGRPVGFINPGLYFAAGAAYGSDFNDVTSGTNDMTGTNSGEYTAGAGYDMASGLGSPNGAALAGSLCTDQVAIANPGLVGTTVGISASPGLVRTTVGTSVSLQIRAVDSRGAGLSYSATGLPAGLSIKGSTGKVTGRPKRIGSYAVTVAAGDVYGTTARTSFQWIVQGAPSISRASLAGVGASRPTLAFTLTAGRIAPALKTISLVLPRGLHFTGSRATVRVTGRGGRRLGFTASLKGVTLTIKLAQAATGPRITIAYPRLAATGSLSAAVARRQSPQLDITVRVTDAGNVTTRLVVKIKPRG
jgi:subtilase family serine protease